MTSHSISCSCFN